jgi:hypothetical protein
MDATIAHRSLHRYSLALLVILVLMLGVHGRAIVQNFGQLHWEDQLFFAHEAEHIHSWGDCLTKPLWPGLYRPLTTNCYYYGVGILVGADPTVRVQAHHLLNLILYAANGLLLFRLASHFLPWGWALMGAAFFVSRRAHTEVVLNTVEFQGMAALFFSLLALDCFARARRRGQWRWLGASCALVGLALLSKESALVLPAILLLYGWRFDQPRPWPWYGAPLMVVGIWTGCFVAFFQSFSDYAPTGFAYTASPAVLVTNVSAYLVSFSNLLANEPGNPVLPKAVADWANHGATQLAVLLLCASVPLLAWRRPAGLARPWQSTWLLGLGFFLCAIAPYAVLADRLFMRYGYFAHAGLALGLAALFQGVAEAVRDLVLLYPVRELRLELPTWWVRNL